MRHTRREFIGTLAGLGAASSPRLACGAHPHKIVQLHWHASPVEKLLTKMGIDWEKTKAEFEAYLKEVEAGRGEHLYDPRRAITSGPGFRKPALV